MMYEYLKKLKAENNFTPSKVLDIGANIGFWTKKVKAIWPDAEYTCIEAGPKYEKHLKEIANNCHIAVLGDSNREIKMYLCNGQIMRLTILISSRIGRGQHNSHIRAWGR